MTEDELWPELMKRVEPFEGYRKALEKLVSSCPRGYPLAFAFHYVDADTSNGGLSQLNSNPTWALMLVAIEAAHTAGLTDLERILREAVLYYPERGRSRFKRQISDASLMG